MLKKKRRMKRHEKEQEETQEVWGGVGLRKRS
jgi:hypothetical protein